MKGVAILVLVLVILVAGYYMIGPDAEQSGNGGVTTGMLVMKITDKPTDNITAIDVTINKIEIHRSASGAIDEGMNGTGNGSVNTTGNTTMNQTMNQSGNQSVGCTAGWITFSEEEQTFDLLELRNITALLGEEELDACHYQQIRLHVEDIVITTADNETHTATVPSGIIKLVKSFWIESNSTTTLVLDFEAEHLVTTTGSGEYKVKPAAIKVSQE